MSCPSSASGGLPKRRIPLGPCAEKFSVTIGFRLPTRRRHTATPFGRGSVRQRPLSRLTSPRNVREVSQVITVKRSI